MVVKHVDKIILAPQHFPKRRLSCAKYVWWVSRDNK